VKHYAGEVLYTTTHFREKNMDRVEDAVLELMHSTSNPLLRGLFPAPTTEEKAAAEAATSARSKKKVDTIASKFKAQLGQLVSSLSSTQVHYIRCIKVSDHSRCYDTVVLASHIPLPCHDTVL